MLNDKNKNSFCPAKWQEIVYDQLNNQCRACCKSSNNDPSTLEQQRENLLNGIRDDSCSYCWDIEDAGHESLRHLKLKLWDHNLELKRYEVVLSNLCNLQCVYCGPQSSSIWATELDKNGPYNGIFNVERPSTRLPFKYPDMNKIADSINKHAPTDMLQIIGGEPLIMPDLLELLDKINYTGFVTQISTNMAYPNNSIVDKLADLAERTPVQLKASVDTGNINIKQYIRSGIDMDVVKKNIINVLENTKITIRFLSLMTAHTAWGILDMFTYVNELTIKYPGRISWTLSHLTYPINQSFNILTDYEKIDLLRIFDILDTQAKHASIHIYRYVQIVAAINSSKYDPIARTDQQQFFKQFNTRHNVETPEELKFLIDGEVK